MDVIMGERPVDRLSVGQVPETVPALLRSIDRLKDLIVAETAQLKSGAVVDFDAFNWQKSRAFFELTQMTRDSFPSAGEEIKTRLMNLRYLLVENEEALKTHLKVMQDLNALIVTTIRESESDGTYSIKRQGVG